MNTIPARLIIAAIFCTSAGPAAATNIVQNPGFEQGASVPTAPAAPDAALPVTEPAAFGLMFAALGALAFIQRRTR